MPEPAEVWITGIGLASSLGEGLDANWEALQAGRINVDEKTFAPYVVHPLAQINFDAQIPKKGDQRQMEAWQRIGTYAAGLALESAGVKNDKEILGRMDMVICAGGGERDIGVDLAILNAKAKGNAPPSFLNERLMSDLRPTLFLAQLSNLIAGNIAIVHGVCGTSRTFMGEEAAGIDAARIALARIAAGQSDIALIGGAHNGERKDNNGFAIGSAGAFLVLESKAHATARGAKPFARLSRVVSDRSNRRAPGDITQTLRKLWSSLGEINQSSAILTGATGSEPVTSEERAFLGE
ncbi:MAG: beta-ketoacyl-ACP synthase, partial [Bradyrhizobium sp.]|nr:beta-ketoacyl-ACP synthase [Bradyrhizobium sp.]